MTPTRRQKAHLRRIINGIARAKKRRLSKKVFRFDSAYLGWTPIWSGQT